MGAEIFDLAPKLRFLALPQLPLIQEPPQPTTRLLGHYPQLLDQLVAESYLVPDLKRTLDNSRSGLLNRMTLGTAFRTAGSHVLVLKVYINDCSLLGSLEPLYPGQAVEVWVKRVYFCNPVELHGQPVMSIHEVHLVFQR